MSKNVTALCLAAVGLLCGVLAFQMRTVVAAPAVAPARCYTGDCRGFNWTNSIPLDQNNQPLPAGATCAILLNQTVWICCTEPNFT